MKRVSQNYRFSNREWTVMMSDAVMTADEYGEVATTLARLAKSKGAKISKLVEPLRNDPEIVHLYNEMKRTGKLDQAQARLVLTDALNSLFDGQ